MSRLFDDASSEYLKIDQAVLGSAPLAMVCFVNVDTSNHHHGLMVLQDEHSIDHTHLMYLPDVVPNRINAYSRAGGGAGVAISTLTISTGTWYHAATIFASATDRRALTNGGNKGTNATSVTPSNLDQTFIGRYATLNISGMIAEAAIWDLTNWPGASNSDKADNFERVLPSLAKGFSPLCYPLGLVAYWPLIRDTDDDIVGGFNMTPVNTPSVAAHPRIILPRRFQLGKPSAIDITVEPATLALALALHAPTISIDCTIEPSTFALALTQHAPTILIDCTVTPATLALALAQHAPSLHSSYTSTPSALTLAATLHPPAVVIDCTITPDTLELATALLTPQILAGVTITPSALALALTQQTPSVLFPLQTILPSALQLALTQQTPSLSLDSTQTPDTLALAVTLQIPSVIIDYTITPSALALALTQQTPQIITGVIITPSALALALTQHAPTIICPAQTITPEVLALSATIHTPLILGVLELVLVDTLKLAVRLRQSRFGCLFPTLSTSPKREGFVDEYSDETIITDHYASGYPLLNPQFTFDSRNFLHALHHVSQTDKEMIAAFYEANKGGSIFWWNEQDDTIYEVIFIGKPNCQLDEEKDEWRIELGFKQVLRV